MKMRKQKEQPIIPDVVITDMKMPKLTGKEVLQRIKKSWPDIPVLIMTAFGAGFVHGASYLRWAYDGSQAAAPKK